MAVLREAIANNIKDSITNAQVSAYMLANPTPPAIHVLPGATEYHQAMGGGAEWWEFTVQAFVAITTDIGAQKLLDKWLASDGSLSVKAAIESDDTLGGNCDGLIVTKRTGYTLFVPDGRTSVLGSEWTVRVLV